MLIAWASSRPTPAAEATLPAQRGGRDHRRRQRGRDHRELDVETAHPGVAERRGLLGVAVDLADGVIDIDERDLVATGQQPRNPRSQPGQQPRGDRVELLYVAVGERAQVGAQRRGRPHPVEQPAHAAVPEQIEVIDAVRTGKHPGNNAARLGHRIGEATVRCSAIRSCSPPDSASRITGTSPIADTMLRSSKTALIL